MAGSAFKFDTFAVICIYCSMEKMIGIYTIPEEKKKNKIRRMAEEVLGFPYPLVCGSGVFLDIPVEGYGIRGITEQEIGKQQQAAEAEQKQNGNRQKDAGASAVPGRSESRQRRRLQRTFRNIRKAIQKKESQSRDKQRKEVRNMTTLSENAFLFYSWQEELLPAELMLAYYRRSQRENLLVFRAEQLIFVDGRKESGENGESSLWEMSGDPQLTIMEEIYASFNYVTIITERAEAWQEFAEDAYEEYGLSVRCVRDNAGLTFREKKTLILDTAKDGCRCMGNFPPESVYLDLLRTKNKSRRIAVRCGRIPYLSLHNALDTVLRDGV